MKPAFALSLSDNGITLLHHSDDEWFGIGTVSLDAPDFSDRLNDLRVQGFALANDLSCIVVIPSDHVRYITVSAEGESEDGRIQKVESELTAATACAIADLIYDLHPLGSELRVAAVAKETIAEARSFASQYGFVPVRFAATGEPGEDWPGSHEFTFTDTPISEAEAPEAEPQDHVEKEVALPPPPAEAELPAPLASQTSEPEQDLLPKVHPIAEPAKPDVFLSPLETAKKTSQHTDSATFRVPLGIIGAGVAAAVALVIGAWVMSGSDDAEDTVASAPSVETSIPESSSITAPTLPQVEETAELEPEPEEETDAEALADEDLALGAEPPLSEPTQQVPPELTPTDEAILEALNIAPSPVEQVVRDPESQEVFEDVTGLSITAPEAPPVPLLEEQEEIYLSSVDRAGLSEDPVALPAEQSFETDEPIQQVSLPNAAGSRFELDERGLVTPTPEGTLNPDGILVYLGRPSSVPPQAPVRFETDPTVEEDNGRLAGLRPRGRPEKLVENFERGQLGGRSVDELAGIRPKARPDSIQDRPTVDVTPTALAVVRVPRPRVRPSTVAALAARKSSAGTASLGSTAAVAPTDDDADSFQPKTVAPKIPSTASVARQATMDNALNLRRLNLIGVYGTPANRRALVRLPSGRYKKLKIGDRIDGGRVVAIGDSELRYQKGSRNITLKMPRG